MASISSLIRSAQAKQRQLRTEEDRLVKFEFDSSAKTWEDYQAYVSHIDARMQTESDPGKLLSYQVAERSAYRTYSSHEIQRQSQSVAAGYGSLEQKYNTIYALQESAIAMGDADTAQSLNGQLINLQNQITNERERAANAARTNYERGIRDAVREYKDIAKGANEQVNNLFETGGLQSINQVGNQVLTDLGVIDNLVEQGQITQEQANAIRDNVSTGYFGTQYYVILDAKAQLEAMLAGIPEGDEMYDKVAEAITDIEDGSWEVPGFRRVNFEEMGELTQMEQQGISPFTEVPEVNELTGATERALKPAPISKYSYLEQADGTYKRINTYAKYGDALFESDADKTYMSQEEKEDRERRREQVIDELNEAGLSVVDETNGQLTVRVANREDFGRLGMSGFVSGDGMGNFETEGPVDMTFNIAIEEVATNDGVKLNYTFLDRDGNVKEFDPESQQIRDYLTPEARADFEGYLDRVNQSDELMSRAMNMETGVVNDLGLSESDRRKNFYYEGVDATTEGIRRNIIKQREMAKAKRIAEREKQRSITASIKNGRKTITTTPTLDARPRGELTTGKIQDKKLPQTISTPSLDALSRLMETFKKFGAASSSTDTSDTKVFKDDSGTTTVRTTARF